MFAKRLRDVTLIVLASVALGALAPGVATAQGEPDPHTETMRNAARAIGEDALVAFDAGQYETALAKFDQAEALVSVPTLGVRAARCLMKLGRWVEAVGRYERTERMTVDPTLSDANRAAQTDALREATAERVALEPRIPTLLVAVEGAAADAVWLDDVPLAPELLGSARRLDPGPHVVRGSRAGVKVEERVVLAEGAAATVALRWPNVPRSAAGSPARPAPASSTTDTSSGDIQRTAGWVIGGAGVTSLAVGIVTLAVALDLQADLDEQCGGDTCRESVAGAAAEDDVASYNAVSTTSIVTLIAGGLLTSAGAVLLITSPRDERADARWKPGLVAAPDPRGGAIGAATLRGSFD